jgi:hypothetical protein
MKRRAKDVHTITPSRRGWAGWHAYRWSRHALRPSSTDWLARFSSSNRIQSPRLRACRNGPSRQANSPVWPPSTGRSDPNRSEMSVCSDRLIRTTRCPVACASDVTRLVLPTPGLPAGVLGATLAPAHWISFRGQDPFGFTIRYLPAGWASGAACPATRAGRSATWLARSVKT